MIRPLLTAVVASAFCLSVATAQDSSSAGGVDSVVEKGVTQPSKRVELAFNFEGIIGKVGVTEGDAVHVGQELMRQDDAIEQARLEGLKLQADQTILIKAKAATLDNKRLVLKRKEESYHKGAVSETEYQEAQLDVVTAEAEVELARHDGEIKQADVTLQAQHVDKMTIKSPVDGVVEKVVQSEGENANIDKASIVVVRNDPLYIDLKTLPTSVVQRLKKGDTLPVRYPGENDWHPATINLIAPVADARAGTQAIRLEMPNPTNRSTGLAIDVKISGAGMADASR